MKKSLIAILTSLFISSSALALTSNFAGLSVGAAVGINSFHQKIRAQRFNPDAMHKMQHGAIGVTAGLLAGYNFVFQSKWLLGPEVNAAYSSVDDTGSSYDSALGHNFTFANKLQWQYGIAAKFGYIPYPRILFYGLVGADWGLIHHKFIHNNVTVHNETTTKPGLLLGLGATQNLFHNVNISERCIYVAYNKIHKSTSTHNVKLEPSNLTAEVVLEYNFNI